MMIRKSTTLSLLANKPRYYWDLIYALSVVLLILFYNLTITYRYIPIQEGWFQYYSLLLQKGMLPYRDFYYFLPPIPLFISKAIYNLGDAYIYYRYYGIAERVLLSLALYYLISRYFSPKASFIAVVTAFFLYQSNIVSLPYSYYQTTYLFFLFALIAYQKSINSKKSWLYYLFTGICASLVFFTKQSNGLFILAFFLFIIIWYDSWQHVARRFLFFCIGYTVPLSIVFGWLLRNHIFDQYLIQVFGGISAKGSLISLLLDFWKRAYTLNTIVVLETITLIVILLIRMKFLTFSYKAESDLNKNGWIVILAFSIILILAFDIPRIPSILTIDYVLGKLFKIFLVRLTFTLLFIASITIFIHWIFRRKQLLPIRISELILASFVWMYSHGMSFELLEHGTLLGIAIIIALAIDNVIINKPIVSERVFTCLGCIVIFIVGSQSMCFLYNWWGWGETGWFNNPTTSVIPQFRRFGINPNSAKIYDKIYLEIMQHTYPDDYVFTFPHISLFNYVTKRLQPTFSPVHWLDVCPDWVAIEDAQRLQENPPKMIVHLMISPEAYLDQEEAFRGGGYSGQRELEATIWKIVDQYDYQLTHVFYTPVSNWVLYVWLKPDQPLPDPITR